MGFCRLPTGLRRSGIICLCQALKIRMRSKCFLVDLKEGVAASYTLEKLVRMESVGWRHAKCVMVLPCLGS